MPQPTRWPYNKYRAITPSDTVDIPVTDGPVLAVYVGTAGNIAAVQSDGTVVTFVGAQAGDVLPITCKRVNSTNTTASNLVALYSA